MRRWGIPLILAGVVFVLDRMAKVWVVHNLSTETTLVLSKFLNLTQVRNPGGAFGMHVGSRSGTVFLIASLVALVVIFQLLRKLPLSNTLSRVGLGLVLGGGVGNLIDRLIYHRVIDFIDLHIGAYHWPAFNLADSAIVAGVALALWGYWGREKGYQREVGEE